MLEHFPIYVELDDLSNVWRNYKFLTSVSKKPGQTIVDTLCYSLSRFFFKQTLLFIIGKSVQLKVEHLMDLVHLVLESAVFVSLCTIIQIIS